MHTIARLRQRMKIHLVNATTGQYFQSPEQWTANLEQATAFEFGSHAINLAYETGIEDAELLLVFELPSHREVRLRLGKACSSSPRYPVSTIRSSSFGIRSRVQV